MSVQDYIIKSILFVFLYIAFAENNMHLSAKVITSAYALNKHVYLTTQLS